MARQRHQRGWVEEVGKKLKKWKGHYYTYDSEGVRHHRSADLGKKAGKTKRNAEDELRAIIERETGIMPAVSGSDTFQWFWETRFAPFQAWSRETRSNLECMFNRHVLPAIGPIPLKDLDKFRIQQLLHSLSKYSESLVHKVQVYVRAALEEAVDQDVIPKNPARKTIKPPDLPPRCKRHLSLEEIAALLAQMDARDRLICRICLVLGLRSQELFACKWDDLDDHLCKLRIDEAIASGRFKETKTEGSAAWVWVPHPIMEQLLAWREVSTGGELIFPSRNGTPMNSKNFLRRHIWPAAVRAGIMTERPKKLLKGTRWIDRSTSVNFQAFRRTCATWFQKHGGVKDTQAHLRHSTPVTTMKHYIQEIPASVRDAVKALDEQLFGRPDTQNLRLN